jgi:hypothetical protein
MAETAAPTITSPTPSAPPPAAPVAAPSSTPSTTPTAAPSPSAPASPPALPENFKRLSNVDKIAALRDRDVQTLTAKPTEAPQPKAEAKPQVEVVTPPAAEVAPPVETEEPEPEIEAQPEPGRERPGPKTFSAPEEITRALEGVQDPKLKAELKYAWKYARDYKTLMPISEAKERLALDPTLEAARAKADMIRGYGELRDALVSDTDAGRAYFLQRLDEENPQAVRGLVRLIGKGLAQLDPQTFLGNALQGFENLGARVRQIEQQTGKTEWTWDEIEAMVRPQGRQPQRPPADHPLVQQNRALAAQNRQMAEARLEQFSSGVMSSYEQSLRQHAEGMLRTLDPDGVLPPKGRERLLGKVVESVAAQVRANPVVQEQLGGLLSQGTLDPAHAKALVDHLMSNASRLLAPAIRQANDEYREELGYAQQARAPRVPVATQPELRPAAPAAPLPPKTMPELRGKTPLQKIQALREAGVGRA